MDDLIRFVAIFSVYSLVFWIGYISGKDNK